MKRLLPLLLVALSLACALRPARAQFRSPKTVIRGGVRIAPDTTRRDTTLLDSLAAGALTDSSGMPAALPGDSLAVQRDEIDTLSAVVIVDTLAAARDTMSISKVTGLSFIAPGFGQIYNKQYWKLPILYSTMGAGIALGLHENKLYRKYKKQVKAITDLDASRTDELDYLQTKMNRHNTARQLYWFGALASYIYFIGDGTVNYKGGEVSRVKKATTLSMICPGAGQIYNGSYWKAPIVIGAFASMVYVIDWNNRGYQRFRTAYNLRVDYDKALKEWQDNPDHTDADKPKPTDEFKGRYDATFLKNLKDSYRRNRDLSIIITAGVYLLNVIDAHVDAHLRDFDISDDLGVTLAPQVDNFYTTHSGNTNVYGFGLTLKF